jgi:putative transposase
MRCRAVGEVRLHPLPGSRNAVWMKGDAWKEAWSVEFLCRIMQVTSRGFSAWRDRPMNQRQRDDMVLLAHIGEQHRLSLQSYGRPRMTEELQELGLSVGHGRVGRLMRENGIKVVRTQKYKVTTDSDHTFNIESVRPSVYE